MIVTWDIVKRLRARGLDLDFKTEHEFEDERLKNLVKEFNDLSDRLHKLDIIIIDWDKEAQ